MNVCVNRKYVWGLILLFLLLTSLSCQRNDRKGATVEREIDKIGKTLCDSFILYAKSTSKKEQKHYTCKYSVEEKVDYDRIYRDFCLITINMKEKRYAIPQYESYYVIFSEKTNLYEALNERLFPICRKKFYDKPFDLIKLDLFLEKKVESSLVLVEHESKNIVYYIKFYLGKFLPKEFKEKYQK